MKNVSGSKYESYEEYRQTLFNRLKYDMNSKDVVIIGYSLKDPHLKAQMNYAAKLHKDADTPGRLFALIYNEDHDRAKLMEDKGIQVAFGGIDQLMDIISSTLSSAEPTESTESGEFQLPMSLRVSTIDVSITVNQSANVKNLFNGYSAHYSDVASGYTFERVKENIIIQRLSEKAICASIIGVAGVGKSTMGRRIVYHLLNKGLIAWEHKTEFPLKAEEWLKVEYKLRISNKNAILLVDDSPYSQRQVNILTDGLAKVDNPALKLLLIAERSQWVPRSKSPRIFSRGYIEEISQLEEVELERLVHLIDLNKEIRMLIDPKFTSMNKRMQLYTLKRKCSADMYVSLKHIFAFEGIDTIILKEYSRLSEDLQDIYRTVAALEASGTRVHRQLIIRLLNVNLDYLKGSLTVLEGLVDEYEINPEDGKRSGGFS